MRGALFAGQQILSLQVVSPRRWQLEMWVLSKRLYILFRCFDSSTALFTLLSWKCKSNKNYMGATIKLIRLCKSSFVRGIVKCVTPCGIRPDVNKAKKYSSSSKLYVYAGRCNVSPAKSMHGSHLEKFCIFCNPFGRKKFQPSAKLL